MTVRLLVFRDRLLGIDPFPPLGSYFALQSIFGFNGRRNGGSDDISMLPPKSMNFKGVAKQRRLAI
jgi:hypothetical protein